MKILALLDGRPGNDNQTIAIAEQLGEYESLKIEFSSIAKLPNLLLGSSLRGVKTKITAKPDLVIATGRKLGRVAAHLKKTTDCKAIQIMHPQCCLKKFDLVFVPQHDGYKTRGNIHNTIGAPNRIDEDLLESQDWNFEKNANVALIGDIDECEVKELKKVEKLHITTSRRTSKEATAALRKLKPVYIYEWSENSENPYYALLKAAKNIIVYADSVGMISEACTTGKKVYIFGDAKKRKFKKFIKKLCKEDYAMPLKKLGERWQPNKLATRDEVVKIIKNSIES